MLHLDECGGVKKDHCPSEHGHAKRGRRAALSIALDEDHLFDVMNDCWPEERPRKLYLGGGMLCLMHPGGEVSIKLKYRYQRKEHQIHLGELGNIPADEIVEKYKQAKALLQAGTDPRGELVEKEAVGLKALLLEAYASLERIREQFPPRRRQRGG